MKKFWIASAAVMALSGSMFADTLGGTGTLTAFPGGFAASTPAWINNLTNPGAGTPFWNDASDDTGLGSGQGSSHRMNVGYVLTTSGGMTGTTSVIGSDTVSMDYLGASGADPTAFSFIRQATAYNVSLIFADSNPTGGGIDSGSDPATAVGSQFGYYVGSSYTMLYNVGQTTAPTGTKAFSPLGDYGFYEVVCYAASAGVCTSSEFYTSGSGNSGNYPAATAWNHFALFQLASGNYVIGFTGQNGIFGENIGDFQDTLVELSLVGIPEPGTIAIMGFGLAGLGLLGRRRFLKK